MYKYMSINVDTAGIKDIDCDGGVSVDELEKMTTFGHAAEQCGVVEKDKENGHERVQRIRKSKNQ